MIRHIVIWDFIDGYTTQEQQSHAGKIKKDLEAFAVNLTGLKHLKVIINPLIGSNGHIMVDSLFEDMDAYQSYLNHPEHLKIGDYIKRTTKNRRCMDYEE